MREEGLFNNQPTFAYVRHLRRVQEAHLTHWRGCSIDICSPLASVLLLTRMAYLERNVINPLVGGVGSRVQYQAMRGRCETRRNACSDTPGCAFERVEDACEGL